ncbi:MAG: alpha/beta hydrolase [Opitutaceae bacterium]|jgi:acetyl esterase/lipase|nr:alpha/beta hydrolase [Opitutaceae bacterium]
MKGVLQARWRLVAAMITIACAGIVPTRAADAAPLLHRVVNLWPDGSPNNPAQGPRPAMEIFYPISPGHAIPAVIVICPGGGYGSLSPYEKLFAEHFRALGYTAVVVNYRVKTRHPAPYADAARAIRLLRSQAGELKVPARNLALMGGSAGGHLAALVATRPTAYRDANDDLAATVSARPDRLILAYPVISAVLGQTGNSKTFPRLLGDSPSDALKKAVSPELHVTKQNPPAFIFHAADDELISVDHSIVFAKACWAAGVPAELHVFPRGGHGRLFAYSADVTWRWRELLRDWLAAWPLTDAAPPK